jgi:hypothetical protein
VSNEQGQRQARREAFTPTEPQPAFSEDALASRAQTAANQAAAAAANRKGQPPEAFGSDAP